MLQWIGDWWSRFLCCLRPAFEQQIWPVRICFEVGRDRRWHWFVGTLPRHQKSLIQMIACRHVVPHLESHGAIGSRQRPHRIRETFSEEWAVYVDLPTQWLGPVLYDRLVCPGISFRYRKSDQEKGENYFDMITTGVFLLPYQHWLYGNECEFRWTLDHGSCWISAGSPPTPTSYLPNSFPKEAHFVRWQSGWSDSSPLRRWLHSQMWYPHWCRWHQIRRAS